MIVQEFGFSDYCNKLLFDLFPEILNNSPYKEIIQKDLSIDQRTSAHAIYDSMGFCGYVIKLMQDANFEKTSQLDKAFDLIKHLISHQEFEVRCVANVSFLECLIHKIQSREKLKKYLRPISFQVVAEIVEKRTTLNPLTWEASTTNPEKKEKQKKILRRKKDLNYVILGKLISTKM